MKVHVKLHGVLGPCDDARTRRCFDLVMRDGVTAGDLLRVLADRCGAPFREALASPDDRLPRHIRMFVAGELLTTREQPLLPGVPPDAPGSGVTVVLLTPMMGG